jgi:cation:H+ antiporter
MTVGERRSRKRDLAAFLGAGLLPVPWIVASNLEGLGLSPEVTALLAGLGILGAAFLLSWATELAERDIPQALAILFLALVSVLPEYAVDLHFAWTAGKDITYAPYAVANMTGANRLLIGLGWPAVVLIYAARSGKSDLVIHPRQRLEIRFLVWATLYSFLIALNGSIGLIDAAVLLAIFLFYAASAMKSDSEEVELVGPALLIDREFGDRGRRLWVLAIFAFSAYGIFVAAAPFADSLVEIGLTRRIDEFLLVQWLAPLASESPEFLIAILFALRLRGSVGIGALISSKVNQWTLLVGAIPIAFCLSAGSLAGLPLDARQTEEMVLTSAQSLLAAAMIANLRFSRLEAVGLATLFLGQFLFTSTEVRWFFTGAYVALTVAVLAAAGPRHRAEFRSLIFSLPSSDREGTNSEGGTPDR